MMKLKTLLVLCLVCLSGCLTTRTVYKLDETQKNIVLDFKGYTEKICKDDDFFLSDEARGCEIRGEMTAIVRPRFFDKEKKPLEMFSFGDLTISTAITLGDCAWAERLRMTGMATRTVPCELVYQFEKKKDKVRVVALADGVPLADIQDITVDIVKVVDEEMLRSVTGPESQEVKPLPKAEQEKGAPRVVKRLRRGNKKQLETLSVDIFNKSLNGDDQAAWEGFSEKKKAKHGDYGRYHKFMENQRKEVLSKSGIAPVHEKVTATLVDISSSSARVSVSYQTCGNNCRFTNYMVVEAEAWKIDKQGFTRCVPASQGAITP